MACVCFAVWLSCLCVMACWITMEKWKTFTCFMARWRESGRSRITLGNLPASRCHLVECLPWSAEINIPHSGLLPGLVLSFFHFVFFRYSFAFTCICWYDFFVFMYFFCLLLFAISSPSLSSSSPCHYENDYNDDDDDDDDCAVFPLLPSSSDSLLGVYSIPKRTYQSPPQRKSTP